MKNLIIIPALLISLLSFSQEKKYYRVVEYFKSENTYIYFHWTTDSASTAKVANTKTDFGAIYTIETKIMTPEKADRQNRRNQRKIARNGYSHIKDIDQ